MRLGLTISAVVVISLAAVAQPDKPKPLPDISLNIGYLHGFTDVALGQGGPSAITQLGYQLHISQQIVPGLNGTFALFTGKIRGDVTQGAENVNFSSSLFSQTVGLEYSFHPLLKPDYEGRQLVRPFIGVGFGAMQFRSKADLKDAQGRTYHWWDDGKIYNQPQSNFNPDNLVELTRDHEYDTDLRDLNRDGLGKYSQVAFTMPLSAGARFQIGKHIGVNASVSYMINFTNLIDDVSTVGSGVRTSGGGFDNNLFASIGLTVFMGRTQPRPKPTPAPVDAPVAQSKRDQTDQQPNAATANQDQAAPSPANINNDQTTTNTYEQAGESTISGANTTQNASTNDAATTLNQSSTSSESTINSVNPTANTVQNPNALSVQNDANSADSNASYTDQNTTQNGTSTTANNTTADANSTNLAANQNLSDNALSGTDAAAGTTQNTGTSTTPKDITTTSNSTASQNTNTQKPAEKPAKTKTPDPLQEALKQEALLSPPKPTSRYHWADLDSNGRITPDEVIHFIDQLFEGNGKQSVQDIQDLIEYYFDQGE